MHELTHWFDFFGTVWGRQYAKKICRAQVAASRGREDDFPKVVELFDLDNKILTPNYYKFSEAPSAPHSMARPWSVDYSCGCEIDPDGSINNGKPIFVLRFGENPSRKVFARQPLSVGALLEVRAMAAEVGAALGAINSSQEKGTAIVEAAELGREMNALAYDHELIDYNVAAHLVSVKSSVSELFASFRIAAQISFVALNMKKADFDRLKIPPEFAPFGSRNRAFRRRMDRGFAFACMVYNGGACESIDDHAAKCVKASNLGSISEFLGAVSETMDEAFLVSGGGAFVEHFAKESEHGKDIVDGLSQLPFHVPTLNFVLEKRELCPPFMDSDCEFIEFFEGRTEGYAPEFLHEEAHKLNAYTQNLLIGCRGLNL